MPQPKHIAIAGAGLAGSLLAALLAQRGHRVEVFEKRPDMRKQDMGGGRSINLALSPRGIRGMEGAGLWQQVQRICIPMHGRMIHDLQGRTQLVPYSAREGEYINSVSRGELNKLLMTAAEQAGAQLHFEQGCTHVDLDTTQLTVEDQYGTAYSQAFDYIFGADGAGSAVRQAMEQQLAGYQSGTDWLAHGYKELSIPPRVDGATAIEKHALHIWPRGHFMLIALPNLDHSFTVTLFLGHEAQQGTPGFNDLGSEEAVLEFFAEHFQDAMPHMPELLQEMNDNPVGGLGTLHCWPWAHKHTALLGDAAHAIVPFYGQGMNASFEDCVVLLEHLDAQPGDWPAALQAYAQARKPDGDAIAQLALDNFIEMRDKTADPLFRKKRSLELRLEAEHPARFRSKYSLVTFTHMPYSQALAKGRAQDEVLLALCAGVDDVAAIDAQHVLAQLGA